MTSVVRQLRDFAVAAALAIVIATVAFVAVRNKDLAQRQIALATRAATAIAQPDQPRLPDVDAALISEVTPSETRPFLSVRYTYDGGCERLSPARGPNDKLFYDAANRAQRTGFFAELLRDGSGRAIAVVPSEIMIACGSVHDPNPMVAIAITAPASPAPYPWLVMIGLLGLGTALAAAGALAGDRAAKIGTAAGIVALAIPCMLWQAWVATTAITLLGIGVALAQHANLTDRFATGVRKHRTALGFLAPAALAMLVLVAAPFIIGLFLGFYDHHHGEWTYVGLDNFAEILSGGGRALDDPLNFWFVFGVTVLWTVVNVMLHVTIGLALALVLSRSWLRGKAVFRVLLILPWAIPNYITALMWKGMFNLEYGAINSLLREAGLDGVNWTASFAASFSSNVATNTWLGFPFMMVVAIGALESIPKELYEAAAVDGASKWQRFRHITLPHLRPALGPAVALGSIWTFNMFNVIHLVSQGQPGGSTNILVTDAYRWAFERGERYGMAAAYATIIFLILLLWTVFGSRFVRRKGAEE